jgi:hypothetical protein
MSNTQESRRSFRVSESVYIKYEVITDEEFQEGLDHRKIKLGDSDSALAILIDIDARLSEAMFRLHGESEKLGKCMTLLNDKINVVVDQMPGLQKSRAALAHSPPLTCDVGANGIVFPSASKLEPGCKLSVQLLLASDNRFVESFCRVIRVTEPPPGNDAEFLPYGIAIEFHGMSRAQREVLIQHMFNRESETLRMRRIQLEQDDD